MIEVRLWTAAEFFGIDFITGPASLFRIPGGDAIIGENTSIAGIRGGEGIPAPPQLSYSSTGSVTMSLAFSGSGLTGGAEFFALGTSKTTCFYSVALLGRGNIDYNIVEI
ncbi:MAG: hypothetical protein GWO07_14980 [Candidatus Dadabacteria bacterium]|nr:hypothetical protein [Candidatus Dadabacteria bacterium]NIS10015.1 hypothetical protein [Candidatus Dadabacteria bacterium]NIV42021.1 hypothetical protein [Candidatus Dadabacteria bacterium]NIX15231.1 hypothetical protein [Candidatus Dadabacteria bacterium]NIY22987.1 hypothetical protein [Candidatus Dadabacteria bacterium]